MTVLAITLVGFFLCLLYERITLNRLRSSIPLVICVTGTRGKSSVVRLIASVLRESGRRVLAKTTGSQAQYVMPDGSILDVPRRGGVSILEQKKALRKAASLRVECFVVEVMSVQRENHAVESQKILKPDVVLLTNVRPDHIDAMGETEADVANVLALDLIPGSKVFLPEECRRLFEKSGAQRCVIRPVPARTDVPDPVVEKLNLFGKKVMMPNLRIVATAARDMGVTDDVIRRGIENAVQDIGAFRVWRYRMGGKSFYVVNAFAANDPISTFELFESAREVFASETSSFTGLLALRSDRGDRTIQWMNALREGAAGWFDQLVVVGGHARALARKLKNTVAVSEAAPEKIMSSVGMLIPERGVLFGFGNIGGPGALLVDHWRLSGEEYGI